MSDSNLQNRTKNFSLEIIEFYNSLPTGTVYQTLGKQLLRSGTSVGANTNSAYRGRSKKEFKAKLGIVIEEGDECIFWLDLLEKQKGVDLKKLERLRLESDELISIFVSINKKTT